MKNMGGELYFPVQYNILSDTIASEYLRHYDTVSIALAEGVDSRTCAHFKHGEPC